MFGGTVNGWELTVIMTSSQNQRLDVEKPQETGGNSVPNKRGLRLELRNCWMNLTGGLVRNKGLYCIGLLTTRNLLENFTTQQALLKSGDFSDQSGCWQTTCRAWSKRNQLFLRIIRGFVYRGSRLKAVNS